MYEKYLKDTCDAQDMLRFKFKAVVTCYYYNELTGEDVYNKVLLENIDICSYGTVGILKSELTTQIKKALNPTKEELQSIMENIELESYSKDPNYVSITPEYLIQSTNKHDCHNTIIYEGDIIKRKDNNACYTVVWDNNESSFVLENMKLPEAFNSLNEVSELVVEVIGNIFQGLGSVR